MLIKRLPNDGAADTRNESDLVDLLCYYKALYNHFQETKPMDLIDIIGLNTPNHHPFDRIDKCTKNEISQMAAIGRRLSSSKLIHPFSAPRMSNERIAATVREFDAYFHRALEGWAGHNVNASVFHGVHRVIYNEILQNGSNKPRCAQLVALVVEALALSSYMQSNCVRTKFWPIAFLYSLFKGRRWDAVGNTQIVVDASLNGERSSTFATASACLSRVTRREVCLTRLRRLAELNRDDPDSLLHISARITTLDALDVGHIKTTPEHEEQVESAIVNARDLIRACEAIINMSEVLPPMEMELQEVQQPEVPAPAEALGWLDQQVERLFTRPEDGQEIIQDYVEEEEGMAAIGVRIRKRCVNLFFLIDTTFILQYPQEQPRQEPAPQAGRAQRQGRGRVRARWAVSAGGDQHSEGARSSRGGGASPRGSRASPHRGRGTRRASPYRSRGTGRASPYRGRGTCRASPHRGRGTRARRASSYGGDTISFTYQSTAESKRHRPKPPAAHARASWRTRIFRSISAARS